MSNKIAILVVAGSFGFLIFAALLDMGFIDYSQYNRFFKNPLNDILMVLALVGFVKNRRRKKVE